AAIFELQSPLTNAGTLTFVLKFENNGKHSIGRPRLSLTTNMAPTFQDTSGSIQIVEVNRILDLPATERSADQTATLLKWYRAQDDEWRKLNEAVVTHARREPKAEKVKV